MLPAITFAFANVSNLSVSILGTVDNVISQQVVMDDES